MADTPPANGSNGNGGGRFLQTWLPISAAAVVVVAGIANYFAEQGSSLTTVTNLQARVADLERRLGKSEGESQELHNSLTSDCQEFAKIETQFGTVETIINEMHIDDLRMRGVFYEKVFGSAYPAPYYEIKIPHEVVPCVR
jgi:hypothetical protein